MLDKDGHIRLVDFGMCQLKIYRQECLPSNFCGTPGKLLDLSKIGERIRNFEYRIISNDSVFEFVLSNIFEKGLEFFPLI